MLKKVLFRYYSFRAVHAEEMSFIFQYNYFILNNFNSILLQFEKFSLKII